MGRAMVRAAAVLTAGVVALAVTPAEAVAAPATCDLAVTVSAPPTPTSSRKAQVRIPPGRSDVRFHASRGTVGPPLRVGVDALVTEFTAAPGSPPVVLVAAVGGSLCGFTAVHIGREGAVPAGLPKVTLAVVEPSTARSDRASDVQVYVFALDEKGMPRRGAAPSIRPSGGAITAVEPLGPGAWRGRWRVPPGEAGMVGLEASFGTEPPATTSVERTPGPPAKIEITRDQSAGGSGAGTLSAVLVHVRDAGGNLTEGHLEFESAVAKLGRANRLERGIYRVSLIVPPGIKDETVTIIARTDGVEAQASLSTAAAAAAEVRVAPHGPIRADASGRGQFEVLEVAVVDAFGNPASDTPVGSGGRGDFREAFRVGPGRWALPYRPPPISEDGSEQVLVTAGAASTSVELELVARRFSVSVGMKAGLAIAGAGTGVSAGAEGSAWMPYGRARLGLVFGLDWWMVSKSSTAMVGAMPASYETTQHYPSILVSAAWRMPVVARWTVGASLGGGGGMVSNRAQLAGQPSVSESAFVPVVSGSLSASPRLGTGALFLELRETWMGDPRLSTLGGSSTTFLGLVGYRFDVG